MSLSTFLYVTGCKLSSRTGTKPITFDHFFNW